MPTTYLYPSGTASNTNWSAIGDTTLHECLDDPHGSPDDTTTRCYAGHADPCTAIVDLDNLPGGIASIQSVQHCGRGQKENAGGTTGYSYVRISSTDYMTLTFNTTAWNTYTDLQTVSPATSNPWTVPEVNGTQLKIYRGTRVSGYWHQNTMEHLDVAYTMGGGTFIMFCGSWLPPLIAVASHCLMKREIVQILRNLKTRPSNDEDFMQILEKFRVRPKYCFQGR